MSITTKSSRSASASGKSGSTAEKEKVALAHPVFNAAPDAQVSLLAQALLREFMHKRKFAATLKTFDEESPRDESTVSSRAVMLNMMHLADSFADIKAESAAVFAAAAPANGAGAGGVETIMETLCFLRTQVDVQRRQASEMRARTQEALAEESAIRSGDLAAALAEEAALQRRLEEMEARTQQARDTVAAAATATVHRASNKSTSGDANGAATDGAKAKKSKKKEGGSKKESSGSKRAKAPADIDDLFASDDEHTKAAQLASTAAAAAAAVIAAPMLTVDDLLVPARNGGSKKRTGGSDTDSSDSSGSDSDSASSISSESPTRGIRRISTHSPSAAFNASGTLSGTTTIRPGDDEPDANMSDEDDYAAALRRIRLQNEQKAVEAFQQQQQQQEQQQHSGASRSLFSSGDAERPRPAAMGPQSSDSESGDARASPAAVKADAPLPAGAIGTALAAALLTALVGDKGRRLPPSFFQGLDFIDANSIDERDQGHMGTYGLVQHEGGPCGALAVLQARLLATLYWTEGAAFAGGARASPQVGADALRRAVATTLAVIAARAQPKDARAAEKLTVSLLVPPATDAIPLLAPCFGRSAEARAATRRQRMNHLTASTLESQVDAFARCRRVEVVLAPCGTLVDDACPTDLFGASGKAAAQHHRATMYDEAPSSRSGGVSLRSILADAWGTQCPQLALLCFLGSALMTHAAAMSPVATEGLAKTLVPGLHADMDEPRPLVVEHGYCSQEMVNLLLAGSATSNVHDGTVAVPGGGSDMRLRGFVTPRPLDVGYLSFLEVRQLLHVGARGKRPIVPVWVVLHESHYTVLFARRGPTSVGAGPPRLTAPLRDADIAPTAVVDGEKPTAVALLAPAVLPVAFDVWYYDQQGGMTEEVRLTVGLEALPLPARRAGTLVSFVDQTLRTVPLWEDARVNWNGADPLL